MGKASKLFYEFRVVASRYSFTLMYVWAGTMMVGLGVLHNKQKRGEEIKYTHEDMKPDEELSTKMLNWIKTLGLDKTVDSPKR